MQRRAIALLTVLVCATPIWPYAQAGAAGQASADDVRIAILVTRAEAQRSWVAAQVSGQGWAAVAHLAGIPYDTLVLEDVLDAGTGEALQSYDALVLAQAKHLPQPHYERFSRLLERYVADGGALIVDGPPAIFDEDGTERSTERLRSSLGLEYVGFFGGPRHRIRVETDSHHATRGLRAGQYVTQHLDSGVDVLRFREGGSVLLGLSGPDGSYPFLSVRERGPSRVALVSNLGSSAGAASFFRNHAPQGFYANRLYDCLVGALQWVVYGDLPTPFPALQLSNADLTAIVRLDADQSYRPEKQIETLSYLVDLARESGVVSLYGWVSADAADAGWQRLAEHGGRLEATGGQIGTHSHHHDLDSVLNEEIARQELDASVAEIERMMRAHGQSIGEVDFLINPNGTIPMHSYEWIAERFSFFMTHGFEQQLPLAYGNITWFTGPHRNLVVLNNTPAPDYQWFYDPEWSYTTAQVTAYQEAIFDHMFRNVGRGVLFNQMWHDYGLTSSLLEPDAFDWWGLFPQERPPDQRPLYDALASKFASHPIYCPDVVDLGQKLRAMAQWSVSWEATDERILLVLDLSRADSAGLEQFTGGMGVRVENHGGRIESVRVNGNPHPAFRKNLIVLPNLTPERNEIEIRLGRRSPPTTRLVYVSKRMPSIRQTDGEITVELLTKSRARFSFYVERPFVLLHADGQEWDLLDDRMLHAHVTSDRRVVLRELDHEELQIVRATLPINELEREADVVRITLDEPTGSRRELWFRSPRVPRRALFGEAELPLHEAGGLHRLELPETGLPGVLELVF